jgi:oleandomycin transport system permease protein
VRAWSLGVPVGSNAWLALVWCLGIVAVFVPLSVRLYRHAASS